MGNRLTQIATRPGDDGTTELADNTRLSKPPPYHRPAHRHSTPALQPRRRALHAHQEKYAPEFYLGAALAYERCGCLMERCFLVVSTHALYSRMTS